jgi:hypothetical protein
MLRRIFSELQGKGIVLFVVCNYMLLQQTTIILGFIKFEVFTEN